VVPAGSLSFGLSLAFPFCLSCDGSRHQSFIEFISLDHFPTTIGDALKASAAVLSM